MDQVPDETTADAANIEDDDDEQEEEKKLHRGKVIGEGRTIFSKISTLDSFVTRTKGKGTPKDLCRAVPRRQNFKRKSNLGPKSKCKVINNTNAITKYFRPTENSVGVPPLGAYTQKLKALNGMAKFSPTKSIPNQNSKLGVGPAILDC